MLVQGNRKCFSLNDLLSSHRVRNHSLSDTLNEALVRHGIELPGNQAELLDRYCLALWSWNEKLNLTRHTDYERFVARDIIDSMALERFLEPADRVLDVGTGGGVPGVVLAILRPDLEMTLCDSVAKKAKAAAAIVHEIDLQVVVEHAPAQRLLQVNTYDTLVARAVAPLEKVLRWLEPCWGNFKQLLIIKGPAWVEERKAALHRGLLHDLELRRLASYPLPGTDSQSVVLRIRPKQ